MRVQLRIVAGRLRGRKLTCNVNPNLRPTPQMVREALFSILGNAVPGRPFVDIFGGSGVVGLEALSRGASQVTFIERDVRLASEIQRHLDNFDFSDDAQILKTDAYRWAAHWQPPEQPVNVFISPPFVDIERRSSALTEMLGNLQDKLPAESVVMLQSERLSKLEGDPFFADWEERRYSRNTLYIKEIAAPEHLNVTNEGRSSAELNVDND